MSEHLGEKTELPTVRRQEEALKRGQIPRSVEIQTVCVVGAGTLALVMTGRETWSLFHSVFVSVLAHLHEMPLTLDSSRGQVWTGVMALSRCVGPLVFATVVAALLAGGMQTRFNTASEALQVNWDRLNVVEGFKRIASFRQMVPTGLGLLKLTVIIALTYGVVRGVLLDPIFYAGVNLERIAVFMGSSALKIVLRVLFALGVLAALDYGYQFWRNQQDLMMTRQEVKDEMKNTEGDPQMKARLKARRRQVSFRKMMMEVPQADVVITNPVRLAVALRYDRRTMKAPRIVAKGSRLNAKRIRELARESGVPVVENVPLARMMFKYGKVGGEIPAQLYAAVAEVLAWVYRVNAYRYHKEGILTS